MLSPSQRSLYWRTWSAICEAEGWSHEPAAKKDERRYAMHAQAGCPQSMTDFNNRAFDKFLSYAQRLLGPSPLNPQQSTRSPERSERERLLWRIRQDARAAGLDEAYIRKLSADLSGLACYEVLALDDLTNLRNAIHNRARKRRQYTLDAKPRHFEEDLHLRKSATSADELTPF